MRKYTPLRARADALAAQFDGLPANYTRFNLCDDLAAGRASLGLDSDGLCLLHYLIKRSRDLDWQPGAEPLVAWTRFDVCHSMGWSEDKLWRVENRLCDAGFIAFRDSPNCKRYAYRQDDGALNPYASGISLAPTGTRALEIIAAAHERQEEATKIRECYKEIFALRPDLSRYGRAEDLPQAMAEEAKAVLGDLPVRIELGSTVDGLRGLLARGRAALAALKAFLGIDPEPVKPASQRPAARPAKQLPSCSAASAADGVANAAARTPSRSLESRPHGAAPIRTLHRKPAEHKLPESNYPKKDQEDDLIGLLTASPDIFRAYLEVEQASSGDRWDSALEGAIARYGQDLSLKPSLVGRMRRDYGFSGTLRALFSLGRMAEKGAEIRNPAAYILSLASKATPSHGRYHA